MAETEDYDKSATPSAHKTSHENGGSDEISVDELSGQLADAQPSSWALVSGKPSTFAPAAHKTSHQDVGGDEISVAGLSGQLADSQPSTWALVSGKPSTFTPEAHKTSHQDAGSDEISVEGLAGELTAEQKSSWAKVSGKPTTFSPTHHKTDHQLGGGDDISVAGLSGLLADPQTNYADRGDPAAADWSAATLTTDGAWHDLDCSGIAPAGVKAVILRVTINHATLVGQYILFRKKGNSNTINTGLILNQVAGAAINSQFIIPCNSGRVIEYSGSNTAFLTITITVIGWFF